MLAQACTNDSTRVVTYKGMNMIELHEGWTPIGNHGGHAHGHFRPGSRSAAVPGSRRQGNLQRLEGTARWAGAAAAVAAAAAAAATAEHTMQSTTTMLGHMPWHARQLYNARAYALAYYIIGRYVMLVRHSRQTYGARAYALAHTINPNVQLIY